MYSRISECFDKKTRNFFRARESVRGFGNNAHGFINARKTQPHNKKPSETWIFHLMGNNK